MKKICVLGLGYIGLPTAVVLATHGFEVVGVDTDNRVVTTLSNGGIHFHEPGLEIMVRDSLRNGILRVSSHPEEADVFIIAVPTPLKKEIIEDEIKPGMEINNVKRMPEADLSCVVSAADSIVPYLRAGNLVVLESTVPPRTTVDLIAPIIERSGLSVASPRKYAAAGQESSEVFLAHCPERVLPGRILDELQHNDRIIGGVNQASSEKARDIYGAFVKGEIVLTDATTAEMAKLMENTFRDVNIALANEFALASEKVGINAWEAIDLANRHPRVNILKPGPGVGGHCIAVDPWFIVQAAAESTPLVQAARSVNDSMPGHVVKMVKQAVMGIEKPVIACLGLAYKADVDDARESPAVSVVRELEQGRFEIRLSDPYVKEINELNRQSVSLTDAVSDADCILVLTDHKVFTTLDPYQIVKLVRHPILIDTRRCLDARAWQEAGFQVWQVGNGNVTEIPQNGGTPCIGD